MKDQLHISIQEKNTSMKNVNHNGSDQLNRLGPAHVPDGYPFPCSICVPVSLSPFSLFSYAHFLIPFVNMQREWSHRVLTP
jgi:hypothetical protein